MAALLIPVAIFGVYFGVGFAIAVIKGLRERGVRLRWMLAWPAALAAAGGLAQVNLGTTLWPIGMGAASLALLIAALWRPGASPARLELLYGLKGWLALGVVWGLGVFAIVLIDRDFDVMRSITAGWWVLVGTAGAYAAVRSIDWYAARSVANERSRGSHLALEEVS